MKTTAYLTINSNGKMRATKSQTDMKYNEIQVLVTINIPDEFFTRPILQATITVDKKLMPKAQPMDLIIKTKKQIEESTGATINMVVEEIIEKEVEPPKNEHEE